MRSDRPRQNWLLVTATIIGVLILVMLAFLIGKVMTGNQSSTASSAPRTSSSQSVSSSQTTSSSAQTTTGSASQAPDRGQKGGSAAVGGPYSVSTEELNALGAFHFSGANMPSSVTLDLNDQSGAGTADFRGADYSGGSMNVTYYSIPTTSIRIFGANNHSIRTVKVNSEIRFDSDNPSNELTTSGSMYAFKNRNGGISLATPNYAGNVDDSERDVLQEVLQ